MTHGINWKRALLGGLAAGLLYDVLEMTVSRFIIGGQYDAELRAISRVQPSPASYVFFFSWGFVIGLVGIFLYAAARARFGPGPRTAARVAFAMWLVADLMPQIGQAVMGIFIFPLMIKFTLQQLLFMMASVIFGAWLYRED